MSKRNAKRLPPEDGRTKVATPRVILLLLTNLLVSREPVYGVAEWAREFDPQLFDLQPRQIEPLNDDRVGRCLDRMARTLNTNLIMDVVRHVVQEFDLCLDELHNDLTTLRDRLTSPRTRFRLREKVAAAVDAILDEYSVRELLRVEIRESSGDGDFPLLTNLPEWTARDVLEAYKRQPIIEKRFSQLKTDFRAVASQADVANFAQARIDHHRTHSAPPTTPRTPRNPNHGLQSVTNRHRMKITR